jgi:hypothetical protein
MLGPEVEADGRSGRTVAKFRRAKPSVLKRRVLKGIPDSCRARAWLLLLDPAAETHPRRKTPRALFDKARPPGIETIDKDIPRTLGYYVQCRNAAFRESLRTLLGAYANFDPEVGYFQGMCYPAAMLLMYMSEMRAFWAFTKIMGAPDYNLRSLFMNGFSGLRHLRGVWDVLFHRRYPAVEAHFLAEGVLSEYYTTTWFLPLFLDRPFAPSLRVKLFDRYVAFGLRALLSFGLTIISMSKREVMGLEMGPIMRILQRPEETAWAGDWPRIMKKWDKLFLTRKDYDKLVKAAAAQRK